MKGLLYAPAHKLVDWTLLPMFLIALTSVTLGGWLSGSGTRNAAILAAEQSGPPSRTTIGIIPHISSCCVESTISLKNQR